jgi:hypothetical protein
MRKPAGSSIGLEALDKKIIFCSADKKTTTRWYPKYFGVVPPSIEQLW